MIAGCTPATPSGVCDTCSGDGEVDAGASSAPKIVVCEDCNGTGGTDTDEVAKFRRFDEAYRALLLDDAVVA